MDYAIKAFYPLSQFPRIETVCKEWQTIQKEMLALNAPVLDIDRFNKTHQEVEKEIDDIYKKTGQYGWVQGGPPTSNGKESWQQYGLIAFGKPIPGAIKTMPNTLTLLEPIQKHIKVCALNTLKANTLIGLHTHLEVRFQQLLQAHITLDAPTEENFAYLNVNGEFFQHHNGASAIFDGALPHFAVNASQQDRTILYMEFSRRGLKEKI